MSLSGELNRILDIIAKLTQSDTNSSIKDTDIISEADISSEKFESYIEKLQSRNYIIEDPSAPDGGNYRMYKITKEGLDASVRGFH